MEDQTFEQFADRYGLRLKVKEVDPTPQEVKDWPQGVRAFKCKIKSVAFPGSLKIRMKHGPLAGEPELISLLNCLQMDAHSLEYCSDEFDFMREFGYDDDPRKAFEIYKACQEQKEKMLEYFGYCVTEELMHCTE